LRDDPDIAPYFQTGFEEVIALARAKGVWLPDDVLERSMKFTKGAPASMRASMAVDLIRGNRIELPWLSGKVVALGRELGVPTPTPCYDQCCAEALCDGRAQGLAWVLRAPMFRDLAHGSGPDAAARHDAIKHGIEGADAMRHAHQPRCHRHHQNAPVCLIPALPDPAFHAR